MSKIVNQEAVKNTYANLLAQRQEARQTELLNKEVIVRERVEAELERIKTEVKQELIEKADEPFAREIALLESFLIDAPSNEEELEQSIEEQQEEQ